MAAGVTFAMLGDRTRETASDRAGAVVAGDIPFAASDAGARARERRFIARVESLLPWASLAWSAGGDRAVRAQPAGWARVPRACAAGRRRWARPVARGSGGPARDDAREAAVLLALCDRVDAPCVIGLLKAPRARPAPR